MLKRFLLIVVIAAGAMHLLAQEAEEAGSKLRANHETAMAEAGI